MTDRYLFLEALISAQQNFYISYIGRSIQDNSERFPSVLVQELIDYIGQSHYLPGDEALNCDESEARVKAHLTCLVPGMPFDPQNYRQANDKAMLVNGYLRPARLVKHILNLFSRCRLPYRKPCRWKRYNDSGHIRCGRSSRCVCR
ncbi:hypothetical protein ACLBR5_08990 [Escherichia coli]